ARLYVLALLCGIRDAWSRGDGTAVKQKSCLGGERMVGSDDRVMEGDILEKRLRAEAERQGVSVTEVRGRMLACGLDAERKRRDREAQSRNTTYDILLVTATITEHRELREAAQAIGLPFEKRQGRLGTYYYLGQIGDNRVASVQVKMGAFGSEGS